MTNIKQRCLDDSEINVFPVIHLDKTAAPHKPQTLRY